MIRTSRRTILAGAIATVSVLAAVLSPLATDAAPPSQTDSKKQLGVDQAMALVMLTNEPVTTSTKVDRGSRDRVKLDGTKTKSYRAQLADQRNVFKEWLRVNAPKARLVKGYDIALHAVTVQLNGETLETIRRSDMVRAAQFINLYGKTAVAPVDPDLALINAVQAWGIGGSANAGAGVKVGIVDSGIQQDHPCFDDLGDSDGANNFTNNKVIIAKVFSNKAKQMGWTAEAVDSHGTHVAGTVACDFGTTAVVDGVTIPHKISGVAPAAKLGNYNVFPGTLEGARSEDILDALEAAYADGMDIVNMSLGGGASGVQDLLTIAVDNLDRGGMLSAVSAGNEGPGFSTVGSPGSAARALTAGASEVPHIVSMSITTNKGTAVATAGEFGTVTPSSMGPIDVVEGTGPAGVAALANVSLACSAIPAGTGVAVISRGVCDFTVKVQNVQAAGYSAVIVVNRENGTFMMGTNGAPSQPTLPAVMVGLEDVSKVVGATGNVTFNAAKYYNPLGVANQMADFSSEGPTDVDRRIKPDVIAPGVNVLSSVVGGTFEFYNGTSMAAPHLAGAAAVLMGRYPAWMPWQVRSAIVNTASRVAISTYYPDDSAADPNLTGSGLLNLQAAVNTKVLLAPVSLNFGVAPSGAGTRVSKLVALHNQSAGTLTVRVVGTSGGATFTASGSAAANSVGLVTVTATTAKGAPRGHAWATLEVLNSSGTVVAHLRLYVLIT